MMEVLNMDNPDWQAEYVSIENGFAPSRIQEYLLLHPQPGICAAIWVKRGGVIMSFDFKCYIDIFIKVKFRVASNTKRKNLFFLIFFLKFRGF